MSKYQPGTLSDRAVNARREAKMRKTINSATQPTGSQVYGTTGKVKALDTDLSDIQKTAKEAKDTADEALAHVEGCALPPGTVLWMKTNDNPSTKGYVGTWELLTQSHVPLTDLILYLFERIE